MSGASVGKSASGSHTYSWSPSTGLDDATAANPTANPSSTTTYTVTKTTTANGCTDTNDVVVTVNTTSPTADAGSDFTKTCSSNSSGATV